MSWLVKSQSIVPKKLLPQRQFRGGVPGHKGQSRGKPIKDRGIQWKESYHDKSTYIKKKFDKILPHSYYRWEGHDYYSGHDYYVVVGPAISKRYGKAFFAGHKKLPIEKKKKSYSPTGEYFPSLMAALAHAKKKWGVKHPQDAVNYQKGDLAAIEIPRHVKG